MSVPCSIVAATQAPVTDPETLLVWAAVLGGVIVVGVMAARVARRRWLSSEASSPDWTLQDLRALRDRGELTDEEFEKLRAAAIAGAGTSTRGPSASKPAGRSDP